MLTFANNEVMAQWQGQEQTPTRVLDAPIAPKKPLSGMHEVTWSTVWEEVKEDNAAIEKHERDELIFNIRSLMAANE